VLIRAAQHASNDGEQVIEFAPEVTQNVETVIGQVGAAPVLWPSERHGASKNPRTSSQDESERNTASHAVTPLSEDVSRNVTQLSHQGKGNSDNATGS
jgi:hypothetical protein